MTILMRLEKPGMELTVCGMPSLAWLDGLLRDEGGIAQGQGGLTEGQLVWREIHRQRREAENGAAEEVPRQATARRRTPRRPSAPRSAPAQFDLVDTEEL